MLVTHGRPRVLGWYHAGPLLFGDWGTSRLYVLGLAFFYTAHASAVYMVVMSMLMAAVAWGYSVICRCYPDGGGVYTAARRISPMLAVIGATLLLCDYVITAALSAVEAMHYFGLSNWLGEGFVVALAIGTLCVIGGVNWLGAKHAGRFALFVAIAALVTFAFLAAVSLRFVPEGLSRITTGVAQSPWDRWSNFTHIVLALSGVEAVANMTGLMKPPVERTSRRTIWPVLLEVSILNLVFCLALNGLPEMISIITPDAITYAKSVPPDSVLEHRNTAMRVLADAATTPFIGGICAIVFGLLLLSAANTAVVAGVSVLYAMAQDSELPRKLTKLNYPGVPWVALLIVCAMPIGVLLFDADVGHLADLYAVGVCGAITINLLSCGTNRDLPMSKGERRGLITLGILLLLIELTIIATKLHATIFAGGATAVVLTTRWALMALQRRRTKGYVEPIDGWLLEIESEPLHMDASRPRIMLAARGRHQSDYAVMLAKKRGADLFAIHVRTLRVIDMAPNTLPRLEDDREAVESLGYTAMRAREKGVAFVPIYVCATDIADEVLDYTVTYGCDTLILGRSRRRAFARAIEGDVVSRVARHLPEGVALVLRDASPFAESESAGDAAIPPKG